MAKTGTKDPVSNNNDATYSDVMDPSGGMSSEGNDKKAMVNSSGPAAGRIIKADLTTTKDITPVASYYEFPSSKTQSFDPWTKRADALTSALGNKDSVRG